MTRTVVVVGASVGGVRTAQALRAEGSADRIVLVGAESRLPYDKPPLSKQLLSGDWAEERVRLLTAEAAAEAGIELRLGAAAERLDVVAKEVHLADGARLAYDTLVLATGASARPSPWRDPGIHVLRTLDDGIRLREALRGSRPVVVVGGGFIGAEVAATAAALGCEVTVVDPSPAPIGRIVGREIGEHFTELHHRHGVSTRFGAGVEAVTGRSGDLRVRLTDGSELAAATVVVGIGAVPNDRWLASSGLLVDNGVVCDEYCRAVNTDDVYAVGDVARWFHPDHREHVRVEHWTNTVDQAACVAHNLTHPGELRVYRPLEYVWSDQYDWKIQIVGRPAHATEHEVLGSFDGDRARVAVLYTDGSGRLLGVVTVNWPKALLTCRRLMAGRVPLADALAAVAALPGAPSRPHEATGLTG